MGRGDALMPPTPKLPISQRARKLGAEFRALRIAAGYPTLRSIARDLGCDITTVSAWERGRYAPARDQWGAILAALGGGIESTVRRMWDTRDADQRQRSENRMRADLRGRLTTLRGAAPVSAEARA